MRHSTKRELWSGLACGDADHLGVGVAVAVPVNAGSAVAGTSRTAHGYAVSQSEKGGIVMPFKHHGVAFAKRRRQVAVLLGAIAAVLAVILASGGSSGHIAPATAAAATKTDQGVYDYVNYTDGKAGPANPKLAPYVIGYTNTEAGRSPCTPPRRPRRPSGPSSTSTTISAASMVIRSSSRAQELRAGRAGVRQQFLSNKKISLIAEGGVSVGGNTLDAVNNGKDVIIAAFGPAVNNNSSPNVFQLYTSADFSLFAFATYGKQVLHAKTNAVLYPDTPGVVATAQAIVQASKAEGMKTTLVTFDANSTDLVGALTAAKAQSADMITPIARSPSQCIAMVNGMHTLGINPNKAVGLSTCTLPTDAPQYWNKDFPTWTIGRAVAATPTATASRRGPGLPH